MLQFWKHEKSILMKSSKSFRRTPIPSKLPSHQALPQTQQILYQNQRKSHTHHLQNKAIKTHTNTPANKHSSRKEKKGIKYVNPKTKRVQTSSFSFRLVHTCRLHVGYKTPSTHPALLSVVAEMVVVSVQPLEVPAAEPVVGEV